MRLFALLLAACGPDADLVASPSFAPVPGEDSDPAEPDPEEPTEPEGTSWEECFGDMAGDVALPEYGSFDPTIGSHCSGTDHQDIAGIERVVFLGDSVTVGTPPTPAAGFYRSILASALAGEFGLEAPSGLWEQVNPFDGTALLRESGAFASCAVWGANARDLLGGQQQIAECFPASTLGKRTLVVMTIGGNDLSSLTGGFVDGEPVEALWTETHEFMAQVRDAVSWLKEPGRFPNGVDVILTDLYEFTDATGDTTSCPAATLAGFGEPVTDPALPEMVVWAMEEFMSIAVDTDSDLVFLLEAFCGHGYRRDDPDSICYRGPGAELWFDATCIHPNPAGHTVIADMFLDVVRE